MKIKFYRSSTEPNNAEDGALWFDSTSKEIKLKWNGSWISYGGNSNQILTQSEYDALATKDPNTIYFIKEE